MGIFTKLKQFFSREKENEKKGDNKKEFSFSTSQLLYAGAGLEQIREIRQKIESIDDWLRYEGVTKSWFRQEFENDTPEIQRKLDLILEKLDSLERRIGKTDKEKVEIKLEASKEPEKEFVVIREPEKIKYQYVLTATDVEILEALKNGPMNFSELLKKVSISKQTLSTHLKDLIRLGKVRKERKGKLVFYSVTQETLKFNRNLKSNNLIREKKQNNNENDSL